MKSFYENVFPLTLTVKLRQCLEAARVDMVVVASTNHDLQHALSQFATECEATGVGICTYGNEAMVLFSKENILELSNI